MKIIDDLKKMYYINSLEKGTNQINQIDNWDKLQKQLEKNLQYVDDIKDFLLEDPKAKQILREHPTLGVQVNYLLNFNQYVYHFASKDFENAFFLASGLTQTTSLQSGKAIFANWALDALGQIKTNYIKDDDWLQYNLRFNQIEEDLINICNNTEMIKPIVYQNKDTSATANMTVQYHGIHCAIAYLKFLDQDYVVATEHLEKQKTLFGSQEVIKNETDKTPLWFYDMIDENKKKEFTTFLISVIADKKDMDVKSDVNHSNVVSTENISTSKKNKIR